MAMRSSFLRTAFRGAVFQGGTGCVQVGFGGVRRGTIAFVSHEHPPHFSTAHWFSGPEMLGERELQSELLRCDSRL